MISITKMLSSILFCLFVCFALFSFLGNALAESNEIYDLDRSRKVDAPDVLHTIASMRDGTLEANFNDDSATDWQDLFLLSTKWGYSVLYQLPPNPIDVAPPMSEIVAGDFFEDNAFIFSGTRPIQFNVAQGVIQPTRAAVLRGALSIRDSSNAQGVEITVLGEPQFGSTLSRDDGNYDLVVNGGQEQVLSFRKEGYLPVHRRATVPAQDHVSFDEVQLTPLDSKVNAIDLAGSTSMQVAQGSAVSDDDGQRTASLFFPAGTRAKMRLPNGRSKLLSTINVRATEFTVGENGPAAMPAELPRTSGYTYCLEYSVDEAMEAGATTVEFDQPVVHYVQNFLGFPVGGRVPTGSYNREKGVWESSPDGLVIKIVAESNGFADLDLDGDGTADDAAALAELGVTDEERQRLADLYDPGQSFWRVPITHFTPWDCNWPYGPPSDAESPPAEPPPEEPEEDDCEGGSDGRSGGGGMSGSMSGSLYRGKNQELIQQIPVLGTPFTLVYNSGRVPGNRKAYSTDILLSGDSVPSSLQGIEIELNVAGQNFTESLPGSPNLSYGFTWDGKDGYGRQTRGTSMAHIRRGFVYDGVYYEPGDFEASFGQLGEGEIEGVPTRNEVILWDESQRAIGLLPVPGPEGLGGWTLDIHHTYDPVAEILYLGNGVRRNMKGRGVSIIKVIAGAFPYFGGDEGVPATEVSLTGITDIAFGPDGTLYYAELLGRVRHIDADGLVYTVAGGGSSTEEGIPATEAALSAPQGICVGPDGTIYVACSLENRVRCIDSSGIITTVAGTGEYGFSGDGGPGIEAEVIFPLDVALGTGGELYFSDSGNRRIRRVDPRGMITTYAGNGTDDFAGNGVPANESGFDPVGIDVASDGTLYLADNDNDQVYRIDPQGLIFVVAGTGDTGYNGDGLLATDAELDAPYDVTISSEGILYILDMDNLRVRRVGPTGIITTVAGNGKQGYLEDLVTEGSGEANGVATAKPLYLPQAITTDEEGRLYVADTPFIRRVGSILGDTLASKDGLKLYEFDDRGRHLRTLDAMTATTLYSFSYNDEGLLECITDRDGSETRIDRIDDKSPLGIVAPKSQRTSFTLNLQGFLATVSNTAGQFWELQYEGDGLLSGLTDPAGYRYSHEFDDEGLLIGVEGPSGATTTLERIKTVQGYKVRRKTALGRETVYEVENLSDGSRRVSTTFACCAKTEALIAEDGTERIAYADGTVERHVMEPHPRWGTQTPMLSEWKLTTPEDIEYIQKILRSATLSDPDDPLALEAYGERILVNDRIYSLLLDVDQKIRTTQTPLGRTEKTWYDEQGRPTRRQYGNLVPKEYTYNANGQLETVTLAPGENARSWQLAYNNDGLLESITDPLNRNTEFEYDAAGQLVQQTLPGREAISYDYDKNGNVVSVTPANRPAHRYTYNPANLPHEYVPPDVGAGANRTLYEYNLDNQLDRVTRPDGSTVDYAYDSAGRLDFVESAHGRIDYIFDEKTGKVSSVATANGNKVSFSWDGILHKATTWSGEIAGRVEKTYNNNLDISRLTVNSDTSIDFQYDDDAFLSRVGELVIARDKATGLVLSTTFGNIQTSRTYDGFGDLKSLRADFADSPLFKMDYERDSLGRIVRITEEINGETVLYDYQYNQAGSLEEFQKDNSPFAQFEFDENGNRTKYSDESGLETHAVYDNQDRLLQYGTTTFSYTDNGALLSRSVNGQTTEYDYDAFGNLHQVTLPDGTQIDYSIDGMNRRIGDKVNGALVRGFLYKDGLNPAAELDPDGNPVSLFVYGSRPNVPEYMQSKKLDGETWINYRILSDHLGSPRLIVNAETGEILQRMDFGPLGTVRVDTNPGFQPFGFAGGLYDHRTGLVRFGARDYDPSTGRWTTKDPIGFAGGDPNLYAYAFGDPVNNIDSTGTQGGKVCEIEITIDPPEAEPGYEFKGTRVSVDGQIVEGKDVHYPKEGAAKVHTVTIVDNHQLSHDIVITYVYGRPEIQVDFSRR